MGCIKSTSVNAEKLKSLCYANGRYSAENPPNQHFAVAGYFLSALQEPGNVEFLVLSSSTPTGSRKWGKMSWFSAVALAGCLLQPPPCFNTHHGFVKSADALTGYSSLFLIISSLAC